MDSYVITSNFITQLVIPVNSYGRVFSCAIAIVITAFGWENPFVKFQIEPSP
jgi:hypothetical protein